MLDKQWKISFLPEPTQCSGRSNKLPPPPIPLFRHTNDKKYCVEIQNWPEHNISRQECSGEGHRHNSSLVWTGKQSSKFMQSLIQPIIQPIESRILWSIEMCHFRWPWTTNTPGFKVTPFFDAEYIRNGKRYRHSFNRIIIGTYTRPTQLCHFEWPWVT